MTSLSPTWSETASNKRIIAMSQQEQKVTSSSSLDRADIHSLTECLHRIHALEGSPSQSALVMEALGLLQLLKENQLKAMPLSVQQRALKLSDCQRRQNQETCTEFAFLFGRCFNLSMNAKIMNQCNHSDATIATRLLTDFEAIASSLNAKLQHTYCDTLAALNLNA